MESIEREYHNLICPWCGNDHLTVTVDESYGKYKVRCPRCQRFVYLNKGDSMCEWADYCIDVIKDNCKYPPAMAAALNEEIKELETIVGFDPVDLLGIMKNYKHVLEANAMKKLCCDCEYEWVPDDHYPCNACRDKSQRSCDKIYFKSKDNPEAVDMVNHPSHYETGKFECIKVMEEAIGKEEVKGFCICNAFKYLYRCRRKNGLEDIKKAKWYIDKFIELCEEDLGNESKSN